MHWRTTGAMKLSAVLGMCGPPVRSPWRDAMEHAATLVLD
jgi:hypothetical protein